MRILTRYMLRAHVGPFVFALSGATAGSALNAGSDTPTTALAPAPPVNTVPIEVDGGSDVLTGEWMDAIDATWNRGNDGKPFSYCGRPVRFVTWNVNSLKIRLPRVEAWLAEVQPDVVCLQETKLADDAFAERTLAEWREALADFSGQWTVVQNTIEVADDPQTVANGYVQPHVASIFSAIRGRVPAIHFGTGNPALYPLLAETGGDVIGVDQRFGPGEALVAHVEEGVELFDDLGERRQVHRR